VQQAGPASDGNSSARSGLGPGGSPGERRAGQANSAEQLGTQQPAQNTSSSVRQLTSSTSKEGDLALAQEAAQASGEQGRPAARGASKQ